MLRETDDDVLTACVAYIGTQRRLLTRLQSGGDPALFAAMSAQLDQLTAAVRQARSQFSQPRASPGG
jgi:hypothetical protein